MIRRPELCEDRFTWLTVLSCRMFHELFNVKFGVETVMVDMTDLEAVKKAIIPGTKLVHIETSDNPSNRVTDIEAIAKIAHENGAII